MSSRKRLTTRGLAVRLALDFAALGFALWLLLADAGNGSAGWAALDTACLLALAWCAFADVRRPRP